jgi:hypothetical protein
MKRRRLPKGQKQGGFLKNCRLAGRSGQRLVFGGWRLMRREMEFNRIYYSKNGIKNIKTGKIFDIISVLC